MKEVRLQDMLDAREQRCLRQNQLIQSYHTPVISMTLNIPGPVKVLANTPAAFSLACARVEEILKNNQIPILCKETSTEFTGYEVCYCADSSPTLLKALMMEAEDRDAFGRILDIDVICTDGKKISREEQSAAPRLCLLCGQPAHACSRSRSHSVDELVARITVLAEEALKEAAAPMLTYIEHQCHDALVAEVSATPKPGLVDLHDSGAHKDMDYHTFLASADAISPHFARMALLGYWWEREDGRGLFAAIRPLGMEAERAMCRATGGVNTHKGIIFSMGILAAAAGLFYRQHGYFSACALLSLAKELCAADLEREFLQIAAREPKSHGEILYHRFGQKGIRGEAQAGFPSVLHHALPAYSELKKAGFDDNEAAINTLLTLMENVEDTNVLIRTDSDTLAYERSEAARLLAKGGATTKEGMDALVLSNLDFTARNISPGGCADLLAVTVLLWNLEQYKGESL